jgi:tRNA G18 (ribose-2'-O)-methylase SpoU
MIDTNMKSETRNLIDHYAYWRHDAIVADLDEKRHNFSVLCCNLGNDFNIATVIRNGNAFLAKEIIIYGSKQFDRRGTVGTHKYSHIRHFAENRLDDLKEYIADHEIVAVDNVANSVPIDSFEWSTKKHTVVCFGQEQIGIPQNVLDLADHVVYIRQYGSVRSLNVGTAAGIAMYDYCRKVCV